MGDSFQILRGSFIRLCSRRVCSPGLTSSQYFSSRIPDSVMAFSKAGTSWRNRSVSSGVQNPITRSTPARLYQLRSKIATSPAAGKCWTYRCMYIWDFSRSVGAGRATTRNTRGLTRSVIRLIVPPFPAVSRPSNTMQTMAPVDLTDSCMATSSPCMSLISRSYSLRFILGRGLAPAALSLRCFCLSFFLAMSFISGEGALARRADLQAVLARCMGMEPGVAPARVPGEQFVRAGRAPGPRLVGLHRGRDVQQRLDDAPGLLHAVFPGKECGVPLQGVAEQPLVGCRRVPE